MPGPSRLARQALVAGAPARYLPPSRVAGLAQLVERWFCKPDVGGSSPSAGTAFFLNSLAFGLWLLVSGFWSLAFGLWLLAECIRRKERERMRFLGAQESAKQEGRDRYRRILASCTAGERDLGEYMMGLGLAVPYRYDFEAPWDWRRMARRPRRRIAPRLPPHSVAARGRRSPIGITIRQYWLLRLRAFRNYL